MAFGDMFKKKLGEAASLVEKKFEKAAAPEPAAEEEEASDEAPAEEAGEEDVEAVAAAAAGDEDASEDGSSDDSDDSDDEEESSDDDDSDDDSDDGDSDDDDARPGESERDRRIREAIQGPTEHVFDDQDNSPQGQKAIEQGIKNKRGGRASYDYTKSKGANFDWPDLEPGELEPWLCYPPGEDGGWVDLNFIADGNERRAVAAYQTTGLGPLEEHETFMRVDDPAFKELERLLALDDAALAKEAKKLGVKLSDSKRYSFRDYFTGMRRDYEKIKAKGMARAQAAVDVAMDFQKEEMRKAAAGKPGLLDPVDGISLEVYATVQVKRSKLTSPDGFPKLLAEYGMDEAKWAKVDGVFMGRMSDPSDPMATAAFATEYGKFYSQASSGKFAAGAKAGAAAGGLDGSHKDIKAAKEPVSFERYVEIMTAQECWAVAGKDVNAMLKKVFDMDASDWSNLGAFWSPKMVADISMAMKLPEYQAKYRPRYQQAGADDDLEV